ncbi:MAG: GNAT family N-acetyltransferase [Victivallaceae bacterium]|nr:GNAT family N-acetyltransferase [Victivallaceae bacterium]
MEIDRLTIQHLDDVMDIQRECYYAIVPESRAAMGRKIELCPDGCFGAFDNGRALGYVLSHPWTFGETPQLDEVIAELPENADSWYLHDIALKKELRGTGAARLLVQKILETAAENNFRRAHIVSIQGSCDFFAALGFVPADFKPDECYGENAKIMFANLP